MGHASMREAGVLRAGGHNRITMLMTAHFCQRLQQSFDVEKGASWGQLFLLLMLVSSALYEVSLASSSK